MTSMDMVIGVDFDNTIVSYDKLLHQLASARGLIGAESGSGKKPIRDQIRRLPDGDIEWQKLQAVMYGPRMPEAQLIAGVPEFFQLCHRRCTRVCIISHKTVYAGYDETRTNLRDAALDWMRDQRFFETNGLGIHRDDVFFGATRAEKIDQVVSCGCTHFIDDLEETFLEPTFPSNVDKLLYAPHGEHPSHHGTHVFANWREITDYFFHVRC